MKGKGNSFPDPTGNCQVWSTELIHHKCHVSRYSSHLCLKKEKERRKAEGRGAIKVLLKAWKSVAHGWHLSISFPSVKLI